MFVGQEQPIIKFKREDLNSFKTMVMIFLISKIVSLGFSIIVISNVYSVIGDLIDYGGTICLISGIYLITKNYPELAKGKKVIYLFAIGLVVDLISAIYLFLYPLTLSGGSTQTPNQLIAQLRPIVQEIYIEIFFGILIGIVTLISAYYFMEWFNDGFSNHQHNLIKSFFYFGIIICIGQFVTAYALVLLNQVFTNAINNNAVVTSTDLNNLTNSQSIATIGGLIILIGIITEIIASAKIYNRVNDFYTGKYYFMAYQVPFSPYQTYPYQSNPYQPNPYQQSNQFNPNQQPNQSNPFQQPYPPNSYQQFYPPNPYQQPYQQQHYPLNQNQNQNSQNPDSGISQEASYSSTLSSINDDSDSLICDNCGTNLPFGTKFCHKCGKKVN